MLDDPDHDLVAACQDLTSDSFESAFEAIYHRYKDQVFNIAYRITGNTADAMDVAQETFSLLLRKIDGFHFSARFSSWLYRIVVNLSIDTRRRERAKPEMRQGRPASDIDEIELEDPHAIQPDDRMEASEEADAVQRAISRLSPKLRAIVVLRYLQGLSYEELAETIEISIGTVKSRLARAHIALERALEPLLGDRLHPSVSGTSRERAG
jgi:RNA polymerase sigma-70 factor (ECF subfamily)